MENFFAIDNIDKIMVDEIEWKGTNKITLRKVNRNLVLEFHNEVLNDDMAKKMKSLYIDARPFIVELTYKKHYIYGDETEVETLFCSIPNDLLLEIEPNKIIDLNLKVQIV